MRHLVPLLLLVGLALLVLTDQALPLAEWPVASYALAALGILISGSLSPSLVAVAAVLAVALWQPLPPLSLGLAAMVGAALCVWRQGRPANSTLRLRWWWLSVPLGWWLLGPAAAVVFGAALLAVGLLAPGGGRPARGLLTLLNTLCGHGTFVGLCLILPLLAPLLLPVPRRGRLFAALVRLGAWFTLRSPPTFCWRSADHRGPDPGPAVIIGNHASVLDILSSLASPGRARVIVAKPWVFASPILGPAARLGGMIPVEQLLAAPERVPPERDVVVFAEGSRSADGASRRFRRGALSLAETLHRPLHCLVQVGTFNALSPRQLWIRPALIRSLLVVAVPRPAGADGEGLSDKVWAAALRAQIDALADQQRAADLGQLFLRCDRWEACAHRGPLAAWRFLKAEWAGQWRTVAALSQPHEDGYAAEPSGVRWAAHRQRYPWHHAGR